MARHISVRQEIWPIRGVFRISRGSRTEINPIVVEIRDGEAMGRGECIASTRYNETVPEVVATIQQLIPALEANLERGELQQRLPPGAARNAVDCALWDLQAKLTGQPVWRLAGLAEPTPVITAFTLSIDTPEQMADAAHAHAQRPLLKLKLAGDGDDRQRVEAVRTHAPAAKLIVDANEAWDRTEYETLVPIFADLGVAMIEQPFKAGKDRILTELPRPVPVCADESCHTNDDWAQLLGCYDIVNIKLDKTGGLSEALALREHALKQGFAVMVGCMVATSLAMAPATLLAQGARFVDLDGPLLLAEDRQPGLRIDGSRIDPPPSLLWG